MYKHATAKKIRLKSLVLFCLLFLLAGCVQNKSLDANEGSGEFLESVKGPINSPLLEEAHLSRSVGDRQNSVLLLETGSDALIARIHLIRSATKSIAIQTLIWADDEIGRLFMYELAQAARRGVRVQFLIDHLSSESHVEIADFIGYKQPNFEISFFNPVANMFNQPKAKSLFLDKFYSLLFRFNRLNHRMHNKTFIVDGMVAITGGRNYQNAYYDQALGMNYKDRDILAIGPVVDEIAASFKEYWSSEYAVLLTQMGDVERHLKRHTTLQKTRQDYNLNGIYKQIDPLVNNREQIKTRFVARLSHVDDAYFVSDPPHKINRIALWFDGKSKLPQELAKTVSEAESSVYIQTPYLALTTAAQSVFQKLRIRHPDIDIRISTNSLAATDSWHVYAFSYKQKQTYLQSLKFRIFEFKPLPESMNSFMPGLQIWENAKASQTPYPAAERDNGKTDSVEAYLCLHGKSMVVDDLVSFVGSYNLDPRSENLNTEAGLFIRDKEFARNLKGHLTRDMDPANSWVIARKEIPLGLGHPNSILAWLSNYIPLVDIWPFRYSASFELINGKESVEPGHKNFYDNYKDVGSFPQINEESFGKELGARGTKAFLSFVKPLL